jgi:hypothetical protein
MFKLAMKSNACAAKIKPLDESFDIVLTHFSTSKVLACAFFEYLKLAEIAIV